MALVSLRNVFKAFGSTRALAGASLDVEAGEFLAVHEYKNVLRWADQIAERPAVQRGRMVNRTWGEASTQLAERHDAADFDTKTQDKLQSVE